MRHTNTTHRPLGIIKKSPDIILFDWDNTFFDQNWVSEQVYLQLIKNLGQEPYPKPNEIYTAWYGHKYDLLKSYFPNSTIDDIRNEYDRLMRSIPMSEKRILSGTEDVLHYLQSKGIPMAIVSNKPEAMLREEIEHFGLTDCFQLIVGGHQDKDKRKPNSYPIEEAIRIINADREKGLRKNRIWMVGDSMDDIKAAQADHIQRIHVGEKYSENIRLQAEGNDPAGQIIYLKDLHELKALAEQLPNRTMQK